MADVLHHEQCPQCAANGNDNSRDNMAVYSDGRGEALLRLWVSCTRNRRLE